MAFISPIMPFSSVRFLGNAMVTRSRPAAQQRACRLTGPLMLHQCPCGRIVSFIGLFGSGVVIAIRERTRW